MGGYFHAYLRNASTILVGYQYREPFAHYLKTFFRQEKKFGSRDRKFVTDLCYGHLRLGHSTVALSLEESIIVGYFLTHVRDDGFLAAVQPKLENACSDALLEKINTIKILYPEFKPHEIFAFSSELSPAIAKKDWNLIQLTKPALFLRIRPGKRQKVISTLNDAGIVYDELSNNILRLVKNIDLQDKLQLDNDCVVQDIASQQTVTIMDNLSKEIHSFWDACAGSGGKSIMVHDKFKTAKIYASDIREEILDELKRRFSFAEIEAEKIFCNDLSHPMAEQVVRSNLPPEGVDLIIADVPCSGSGTWGRSPEWLTKFDVSSIDTYSNLQKSILGKLMKQLRKGNYLLYITCSVFEKENEDIVEYAEKNFPIQLIKNMHFNGEEYGGDHLFGALFTSVA